MAAKTTSKQGLFLTGKCVGRRRREFKQKDGTIRYSITMQILAEKQLHRVERWTDIPLPADVPAIGDEITLEVVPRAFVANGRAEVRLGIAGDESGVEF